MHPGVAPVVRPSLVASVAVAAAVALGSAALAGGPLYVSSAATADLQTQLTTTCATDAGLRLPDFMVGRRTAQVRSAISGLVDVRSPITTSTATGSAHVPGGPDVAVTVVSRTGQEVERGIAPLGVDEVAVPASTLQRFDATVGDTLTIAPSSTDPGTAPVVLTIAESYPDVPVRPEPTLWCGLRSLFRPGEFGDLPPPVLLVSAATFDANGSFVPERDVEWQPGAGMTRDDAASLAAAFATSTDAYRKAVRADLDVEEPAARLGITDTSQLGVLVGRSEVVADVVGRTVTPVVLTGLAGAVLVLAASGLLVARRSAVELRLRQLRGASPFAVGVRITAAVVPAAVVGAAVGTALAVAAITTLGPSSLLEADAVRTAVLLGVVGAAVGTLVVAIAATATAVAAVDGRSPARHRRWVPWELVLVIAAIASFVQLDRGGGVQLVGASVRGGDLLVQAFPLLVIGAALGLAVRPLRFLLARLRRLGRRWPLGPLIAMRRWCSDPAVTIATVLAAAFIAGLAVLATSSTASAEQSLRDKSRTFNGSDLVVRVLGDGQVPAGLADRATIVRRLNVKDADGSVDVIGIDTATFGRGVHWLDGAAGRRLADVDATLDRGASVGIAVGGSIGPDLQTSIGRDPFSVDVAAEMPWFPGLTNGARLVVVDADALVRSGLSFGTEIWIRDPPDDATTQLAAAGWRTIAALDAGGALDATGFRAMRYAFGSFSALAALGLVVLVIGQLLVIDARTRRRAAADVINRSIGLGVRTRVVATLGEFAVPPITGAILGVGISLATLAIANADLDPLRALRPPARVIVDIPGIVAVLAGIVVIAIGLVIVAMVAGRRSDPMGALRGR